MKLIKREKHAIGMGLLFLAVVIIALPSETTYLSGLFAKLPVNSGELTAASLKPAIQTEILNKNSDIVVVGGLKDPFSAVIYKNNEKGYVLTKYIEVKSRADKNGNIVAKTTKSTALYLLPVQHAAASPQAGSAPTVTVIAPNAGGVFHAGDAANTGDWISFVVSVQGSGSGNLTTYLVKTNDSAWSNSWNYFVEGDQGINSAVFPAGSIGGFQINNSFPPGTYYLYSVWQGNDGSKAEDFSDIPLTIAAPSPSTQAPVAYASIIGANTVTTGAPVLFRGVVSAAPGATVVSYIWNFGDGATAMTPTASHAYATAGNFTATLTVTDNLGGQSSASVKVTVNGIPGIPPGALFDLSHWKITVPNPVDTTTGQKDVTQPALATYSDPYFFTDPRDNSMTFWLDSSLQGHTANSDYIRSELRERWNTQSDSDNWPLTGTHTLTANLGLDCGASNTIPNEVTVMQIHAKENQPGATKSYPLLRIVFYGGNTAPNGAIFAVVTDFDYTSGLQGHRTVQLTPSGSNCVRHTIQVKIQTIASGAIQMTAVVDGGTQMILAPDLRATWAISAGTYFTDYFKAGDYAQANIGISEIHFYSLTATHQ